MVPPDALKKADRKHGRSLFAKTCPSCHTLFNDGGKIGSDLTGSHCQPQYLLMKLLDPIAVVAKDYQMTVITTKAGRTISGLVKEETDKTITMQTQNEVVRLPKSDIEEPQPFVAVDDARWPADAAEPGRGAQSDRLRSRPGRCRCRRPHPAHTNKHSSLKPLAA